MVAHRRDVGEVLWNIEETDMLGQGCTDYGWLGSVEIVEVQPTSQLAGHGVDCPRWRGKVTMARMKGDEADGVDAVRTDRSSRFRA